jgi:hypothetical protein
MSWLDGNMLIDREEMYRGGGLFSVTSKILVNDFLSWSILSSSAFVRLIQ